MGGARSGFEGEADGAKPLWFLLFLKLLGPLHIGQAKLNAVILNDQSGLQVENFAFCGDGTEIIAKQAAIQNVVVRYIAAFSACEEGCEEA